MIGSRGEGGESVTRFASGLEWFIVLSGLC